MKILLFYRSLDQGGVQKMMVTLANGLAARDHEVTLLLIRKSGGFINLVDERVTVSQLERSGYLSLLPQLKRTVKDGDFDVLFTATPSLNVVASVVKILTGTKTKLILSE